jgi:arginine-tRNA-protein transferase
MTQLTELQFYSTPEHDCSYIADLKAKTLFIDPKSKIDQKVYSQLSELGFRRSGTHIYRPHCEDCKSCISIRIPAKFFKMSKSQKRIFNRNKDLKAKKVSTRFTDEYYALYETYINTRHKDGDMYPPSIEQFKSFLVDSKQQSYFIEFRSEDGALQAIANMDQLEDSHSAVYTFYNPLEPKRSLGTFAILWQLEEIKKSKLNYLYLGYWVEECQKMKYKTAFSPLELLINGRWRRINDF